MKLASILFLISFSAMASNEIKLENFRIDVGPVDRHVDGDGYINRRDTLTGNCSMSAKVDESGNGYVYLLNPTSANWMNFRHVGDDVYLSFSEIGLGNYDKCKKGVRIEGNLKIGSMDCKDGPSKLKVIVTTDLNGALKNVFTQYRLLNPSEFSPIRLPVRGKMNCGI